MRDHSRVHRCSIVAALSLLVVAIPLYADLWQPQDLGFSVFVDGGLSLALDDLNRPGMTFHGASGGLIYSSLDGGSWSSSTVDSGFYAGRGSDLTYTGTTPHMAYRASDGTNHYLGYATFTDSWQTTAFTDVDSSNPRHFAADYDSEGYLGIVYYDAHGLDPSDDMVYYRYYDGTSWSSRETITGNVSNVGGVGFAYDQNDTPYAAFVNDALIYWRPSVGVRDGTWSLDIGLGGEASDQVAQYLSLALDGVGRPHLAWVNNDPLWGIGQVNYAWFDGSDWHMETAIDATFYTGWEDRRYLDMTIDSWGYSHILYYDPAGEQVLYTVGRPGDFWQAPRVLADNLTAYWLNVEVDSDNAPHFAYYSGGSAYYGKGEPIPEPGTIILLASGLGALAMYRRRRSSDRG